MTFLFAKELTICVSLLKILLFFLTLQGLVSIENVTIVHISNFDELTAIISRGSEQRHTAGTQMNDESSRSHLIVSIIIESTNLQTQSLARGKVHIIFVQKLYVRCQQWISMSLVVLLLYYII